MSFGIPGVDRCQNCGSSLPAAPEAPTIPGMTAALLAALVAAAPVLAMTDAELDAKIADAHRLPFADRIGALSELFVGVPYTDLPLGDGDTGPEPGPLFRTDGVDCQTYVETVLAMANAGSLKQAKSIL